MGFPGAVNAVYGIVRNEPGAQDQHSSLAVMRALVQAKIDSSIAYEAMTWSRPVGCCPV